VRRGGILVGVLVVACAAVSCGSSGQRAGDHFGNGGTPPSFTTTSITTNKSAHYPTTTAPCTDINGCTTINPKDYHPNYDTISALALDSTMVFIGTVGPTEQDPVLGTAAPFTVDRVISGAQPSTTPVPAIPEGSSGDIPVVFGHQYLVFWAIDLTGNQESECVVGGMRGLFKYDPTTQTVTRSSTSASKIPATLTLAMVIALLPDLNIPRPARVPPPPVCSPSVTGD
jgi:hypothetical protein